MSEIIREAVKERCRSILDQRLDLRIADVIGVVRGGGGRADATGKAFAKALRDKRAARPK